MIHKQMFEYMEWITTEVTGFWTLLPNAPKYVVKAFDEYMHLDDMKMPD